MRKLGEQVMPFLEALTKIQKTILITGIGCDFCKDTYHRLTAWKTEVPQDIFAFLLQ
ncbi:MAG: hypothetical protein LHW51_13065 [Candidatus Cloacimonetes bacterium]|nr:hypothetical protein [Candidatus Cloacimonadota bacterium]